MNMLVMSALLLSVLLVLVWIWHKRRLSAYLPCELQEALLSPAEWSFLNALTLAVGNETRVFTKVHLASVLTPKATLGKKQWQQLFNQINDEHIDFLLCHPDSLRFICALTLDEAASRHLKRQPRESLLQLACDSAGLPLLQIPVSSEYPIDALRAQILPLLLAPREPYEEPSQPGERREPTFNPRLLAGIDIEEGTHHHSTGGHHAHPSPVEASQTGIVHPAEEEESDLFSDEQEDATPHCPRCAAPLIEREVRKGPHAGQLFLACTRFPDCRYVVPRAQFQPHPHHP
ncbi:DUF2726 domain-containing protein [Aeromonas cavernicola]|uniref:Topoisomerase n=1 Tax=Aeromonas cavernicola TaxID=1006623 RepID=A0A2H9U4R3_9GAMM|nr:DUF2726 domain-containing protein [Aeromonas cavernicola]PJG58978.1 topoisomerase [Aeromonas cavernicola]